MSDSKTAEPTYTFSPDEVFMPCPPPEERRVLADPYIWVSHNMSWATKGTVFGVIAHTHCSIGDEKQWFGTLHVPNKSELFPPPLSQLLPRDYTRNIEAVKVPIEPITVRYDTQNRRWEVAPGYSIQMRPEIVIVTRKIGGVQYLPWDPKLAPKA